jgi:hypothetical protein
MVSYTVPADGHAFDISEKLIHFTSGESPNDAFAKLRGFAQDH